MSSAADRIGYLKGLHEQWTTELQHLVDVSPDRAFHLAEALDDLKIVIAHLEAERPRARRTSAPPRPVPLADPLGLF